MKERGFACASVTRKAENSIKSGHPWVYNTEITGVEGNCENGDLVDVRSGNIWEQAFLMKDRKSGSGSFPLILMISLTPPFMNVVCAMRGSTVKP